MRGARKVRKKRGKKTRERDYATYRSHDKRAGGSQLDDQITHAFYVIRIYVNCMARERIIVNGDRVTRQTVYLYHCEYIIRSRK